MKLLQLNYEHKNPDIKNMGLMIWIQATLFMFLNAIWFQPETIMLRNVILSLGALVGLYQIYLLKRDIRINSIPLMLLLGLFFWITVQVFFLSGDLEQSFIEYKGLWKRTFLGAVFAFGFAISLAKTRLGIVESKKIQCLLFLGLIAPSIIYSIKYLLTFLFKAYEWPIPEYARLSYSLSHFYIAKAPYVAFCVPALAAILGVIYIKIKLGHGKTVNKNILLLSIISTFFIFFGENIKNGVVYSALIAIIFFIIIAKNIVKSKNRKDFYWIGISLVVISVSIYGNLVGNNSWRSLPSDLKIATSTEKFEHWKYDGAKGYPLNDEGKVVSATNYERIAWAITGFKLLLEYPLGFGLVEQSFGRLAKLKWPESNLSQTHSGWIDLSLGIGIPGIILILSAMLISIAQLKRKSCTECENMKIFQGGAKYTLIALLFVWITTENSQKIIIDHLIFYIAFSVGLLQNNKISNKIVIEKNNENLQ